MDIVSYHEEFRTALFTSSLTLGTFLFTMKTFIIQTIKKEIYDHKLYKERMENIAKLAGKPTEYYKPLKRLSRLIFSAIVLALVNAFVQISLGYVGCPITAGICLASSFISWLVFGLVLLQVGNNMRDMLDFAEEDSQNTEKKAKDLETK